VQPSQSPALQECRGAAEDQPHEILENGLLDRGARELQRDALEAIDVDERHGHDPRPIVDTKRDPRRDHGRDRKDALAQRPVGIFDAGNTGFSSEIGGDVDQLMPAFRRQAYSSVIFKLRDPSEFESVKKRIEDDPRLTLEAKRENRYYAEQSERMAQFLRILGTALTVIFSLGAIIGAMITMYSAVATRTGEIGTMRALGFERMSILAAFIIEALFLGLIGGCVGLFLASFLQLLTVSTMNFQTFSELAFSFALTSDIVWKGLGFSLVMGFIGGLLPAVRASRMNIVESLRTV
jgi:putative ABC transport system permease protein